MKFRYDINALRALAVIGVILFHFKVPYFEGGFSGVDIFYVISGYLMTKIVIEAILKNTFSFRDFYSKRVKRIIPALLFMIVTLLVVDFFILLPGDYQYVSKNATASLLFLSNILYWQSSGYFDPSSELNPLLHTWSLSVEWQFYLILPIILVLLRTAFKFNKKHYLLFFVISTSIIFIITCYFTQTKPTASFYLLPTRSWEMVIGGIAYLAEDHLKKYRKGLACLGYLVLFLSLILLTTGLSWPGIYTLIPVLATFLIILANQNDFTLLKHPVIQFTGKISYSLYLWHWPVFVTANYLGLPAGFASTLLLLIISFSLAYISFTYIESLRFQSSRYVIATVIGVCTSTFVLSYYSLNEFIFKPQTIQISNYTKNHLDERKKQFSSGCCFISTAFEGKTLDKERCLQLQANRQNILLIGDSHAAHLSQSLREHFEKEGIHLNQASASGCLPLINANGRNECVEIINYIYHDYIKNNANLISGVIISGNWLEKIENKEQLITDLRNTIDYLHKLKIKAVIIGQNETYTMPYASIAALEYEHNETLWTNYFNRDSYLLNEALKKEFKDLYINIYSSKSIKHLSEDLTPYMSDENHFTKYGADLTVGEIVSQKPMKKFLEQRQGNRINTQELSKTNKGAL